MMIILFTAVFIFGLAVGLTVAIFIPVAYGQTPTVAIPNPQSGLNFLPQKAYVTTLTPDGIPIQLQPIQPQQSNDALGQIGPYIMAALSALGVKILGDRKTARVADVVQDVILPEQVKQNEKTKEVARVMYDMNPTEAAKIDDAPTVKIATLTDDANKFAETAAKTKT